jgi:hypothetical protein
MQYSVHMSKLKKTVKIIIVIFIFILMFIFSNTSYASTNIGKCLNQLSIITELKQIDLGEVEDTYKKGSVYIRYIECKTIRDTSFKKGLEIILKNVSNKRVGEALSQDNYLELPKFESSSCYIDEHEIDSLILSIKRITSTKPELGIYEVCTTRYKTTGGLTIMQEYMNSLVLLHLEVNSDIDGKFGLVFSIDQMNEVIRILSLTKMYLEK